MFEQVSLIDKQKANKVLCSCLIKNKKNKKENVKIVVAVVMENG